MEHRQHMDDFEGVFLSKLLEMEEEDEFADDLWTKRLVMEDKVDIDTVHDMILWSYNN